MHADQSADEMVLPTMMTQDEQIVFKSLMSLEYYARRFGIDRVV